MSEEVPLPDRPQPAVTEPYWDGAQQGELRIPFCEACERRFFPPRALCPHCLADEVAWEEASGRGTVYSFNVVHHHPNGVFDRRTPYVVGFVRLAEGVYLYSEIVDCDPDTVEIGMPVTVTFDWVADDVVLPKFEPRK